MLKAMDDVEAATARHPVPAVACHNDLLSENFIVDADGKMWIIDWEYGGMADPYFDLGDHVMEHPYSRDEERLIIETYCGAMDERFFARLMLYKALSGVWWGVWAMIQHTVSQIDFDYMEWGRWRVARAEAGHRRPRLQGLAGRRLTTPRGPFSSPLYEGRRACAAPRLYFLSFPSRTPLTTAKPILESDHL